MGAVRITSLNPKFNGSHFVVPPSSIHRMTGWVANCRILWCMRTTPITFLQWGLCPVRHGIQISMEAILACHPARSTKWLDCHPKSCELHVWRIRTRPIPVESIHCNRRRNSFATLSFSAQGRSSGENICSRKKQKFLTAFSGVAKRFGHEEHKNEARQGQSSNLEQTKKKRLYHESLLSRSSFFFVFSSESGRSSSILLGVSNLSHPSVLFTPPKYFATVSFANFLP